MPTLIRIFFFGFLLTISLQKLGFPQQHGLTMAKRSEMVLLLESTGLLFSEA